MNREEFMKRLEALLSDLSIAEREEALQYYNDYFDDAGVEQEEQILKELGSPEMVARIIKDGLNESNRENGEYSERGYSDARFETNYEVTRESKAEQNEMKKVKPAPMSAGKVALLVLLVLFAIPVGLPILFSALGVLVGIIATAFGIFVAIAVTGIALFLSGIVVFFVGAVKLFTILPVGIFTCGVGLILTAVGLLFILLTVLICTKLLPVLIRGFVSLCQMPFRRRKFA